MDVDALAAMDLGSGGGDLDGFGMVPGSPEAAALTRLADLARRGAKPQRLGQGERRDCTGLGGLTFSVDNASTLVLWYWI